MKTLRLAFAIIGPALCGCAAFDPPVIVDPQLAEVAAQLHTPEMDAAIQAARPGVPRAFDGLKPERDL